MSAGTGIMHSEANPSATDPVHLLQIWIVPDRRGLAPGYEQRAFDLEESRGRFRLLAAPEGRDGALTVHQDVRLWLARLIEGERDPPRALPRPTRLAAGDPRRSRPQWWAMTAGDGAAVSDETSLTIAASTAGGSPALRPGLRMEPLEREMRPAAPGPGAAGPI